MYAILLLDVLVGMAVFFGFIAVAVWRKSAPSRARATAMAMIVMSSLPLVVGLIGWQWGLHKTEQAIASLASFSDDAEIDALRRQGEAESINNLWFGVGSMLLFDSVAAIAFVLALSGRPKSREDAPSVGQP